MKRILLLVGALFLLISCTDELDQMINGSRSDQARQATVFQASVEGCTMPETKVYADEHMKVLWNADDRISIFNFTTFNAQYAFTGDDGDTAGGFDEVPASSSFITGQDVDYVYAAYPYSKNNKLSNSGVFTMELPAVQLFKDCSFGIGANTMVAIADGAFLAFKNVGGYLSLRLYGDDIFVTEISIRGNNGEKIAGKASIDIPFGGTPTVTMNATATNVVSVVCDPAVKIGGDANNYTDFWFVIPPVTFSKGFTITVKDDKGGVFEKSTSKSFTVSRNTLDWMNPLKVVPTYQEPVGDFVQFEDEEFKAFCLENYDWDYDGELSLLEAQTIEELGLDIATYDESTQIWFQRYNSLKGIEYFTNLRSLYISGPGSDEATAGFLSPLDLSHNTALTTLSCVGIRLEELNVSGCTKLTHLNCFDNNLESLDVSTCTALTFLECSLNKLTSLNLQTNTMLKNLECASNQLTSLNVSYNTQLTSLNCSDNQLTYLDVTNCPLLVHLISDDNSLLSLDLSENFALERVSCSRNQLTTLDLGNNTFLTSLNCEENRLNTLDVSGCISLSAFFCNDNKLTDLVLGDIMSLTSLNCFNNDLTSLDVSHNTALNNLQCQNNQLLSLDVRANKALSYLDCQNNQMTSLMVKGCKALTTLNCLSNQLTSLDVSSLTSLTGLECRGNHLTSLNVDGCTGLIILNCLSNQLTSLDVSTNCSLSSLNCLFNPLLTEIWLKNGQIISSFRYDTSVATIKYID